MNMLQLKPQWYIFMIMNMESAAEMRLQYCYECLKALVPRKIIHILGYLSLIPVCSFEVLENRSGMERHLLLMTGSRLCYCPDV